MKIRCSTLFDITHTGVDNHNRTVVWPYVTRTGLTITNQGDLLRARNQQRNLDTIIQVLSMRTQPLNIGDVEILEDQDPGSWGFGIIAQPAKVWSFTFEVETPGIWTNDKDELYWLRSDTQGVPMILNLTETVITEPWINSDGPVVANLVYTLESDK